MLHAPVNVPVFVLFPCQKSSDLTEGFCGELACQEVQNELSCPPPEQAKTIWDLTQAEVQRCFTQPLRTIQEIEERRSGAPFIISWILRGMVKRDLSMVEKRRSTQWAAPNETTHTIGVGLIPAIADMLICKVRQSGPSPAGMDGSPLWR